MRIPRAIAFSTCLAVLAAVTACSGGGSDPAESPEQGAWLYGSDGNMSSSFGDEFTDLPGLLDGMKGTTPLVDLPTDFVDKLKQADPTLKDFTYAGEAYDAVMVAALAAQLAGTTDPRTVAQYVTGVTTGGTVCHTARDCLDLARAGTDLAYRGITIRYGFTDAGEPATASYATLHFDQSNQIDAGKTEFLAIGNERDVSGVAPPKPGAKSGSGPLTFGGLLPLTGELAVITAPMTAAAASAVKDVNDAGGVLGRDVVWIDGDDGTDPKVAKRQIEKHAAAGVDILIGTGASGVARAVLPDVVANGMIMISPSNTAAKLTTDPDDGLYFRTSPSDVLQARALADVILRDGVGRVAIIAHDLDYGVDLMADVRARLLEAGLGAAAVATFTYHTTDGAAVKDPAELAQIAAEVSAMNPEGILVIGYGESAAAIKALHDAGVQFRR